MPDDNIVSVLRERLGDDVAESYIELLNSIQENSSHTDSKEINKELAAHLARKEKEKDFSLEYQQYVEDMYVDVYNNVRSMEALLELIKTFSLCPTRLVREQAPWKQLSIASWRLSNYIDHVIEKLSDLDEEKIEVPF